LGLFALWDSYLRGAQHRALRHMLRRCVHAQRSACSSLSVITAGFLLLLCACVLYLPEIHRELPDSEDELRSVTLLVWTHPFGQYRRLPDYDPLEYSHVDAVIIHHRDTATGAAELPPEPRPRAQKWIWMNYESPAHTPGLWKLEHKFNLTLSYRADSDIFLPYGYLVPGIAQSHDAHLLHAPSRARVLRPRLVAWVISNWSDSQARVAFYHELQRYVHIDVYGQVGLPLASGSESVIRVVSRYQFYLSFENSQHTDYITEKLWNAVVAGAVPVVLGPTRLNYERFLPPEAFIHVDDFPSVRALARYLLMLRRNPNKLHYHLDWRKGYSVVQPTFWAHHYCAACRAVRKSRDTTQVVHSLERWFWSDQG
uniref:Fucosyltransferase n=1 Tax=Neogobius melanostomus TaxID=47308 RepID=A0A8C6T1V3_9GOBI